MGSIFKQNFSYKLDIGFEPDWFNLYKRVYGPKSERSLESTVEKKIKQAEANLALSLWGRRYHFTEYYDSTSGLTAKFQTISLANGESHSSPVDEFRDAGYVFKADDKFSARESEKAYAEREKLSIEVGEAFIRNDIFEKVIGGRRSEFDYEKGNYLFRFPLLSVFNFLFALGMRFHGLESKFVIKWSDDIEKQLKECGISYETFEESEPEPFDIEGHDKKFFEKWGRPQVSLYSGEGRYFMDKDGTIYNVELKVFHPDDNDRILIES